MSSAVDLGTRTGAAGCSRSVSDTTFWSFHLLLKAPSEYLHEGQVFSRMPRATISGDESRTR
ncbi:hypothetical protein AT4G37409 [Arabidopsis thaliana]|uniref:Uncharacterized protein n=1 Tax=Arabidopsis thaliana TaxID=3702 RepID=A0A1P8B4M4_ARATH|nr:uncharacterized protein AT4G37409 [Arabidopsis thaliana]ANM66544.1 hypothetical protein AT4G37409 [Arabidopsis thaliana]|eukprot:NP_001328431.1 hypothetical protein AT4G37409 [Arabidopsis thaliana]